MLKRIKISGYKSLKDVEVVLTPLTVLIGANASGKSNFLDALQLLSKTATARTLKEAFSPPYRGKPIESFTFADSGLEGMLKKKSHRFSIEIDVELSPSVIEAVNRQIMEMRGHPRRGNDHTSENGSSKSKVAIVRETALRYRLEIEILPQSGFLRIADEYLAALNSKGEPAKNRQPFLSRKNDKLHLRMEGQAHPTYHDLLLDHTILSLPHYPPHYPHLTAMRKELESWLFFYFEPRERMREANSVKEVRHIGLMGEELAAFLNTLQALDIKQFSAIEKAMNTILPNIEGIDVQANSYGEVELKLIENGIPVPARVLSEGTLRILGLLALTGAKEQPALVGFEEPENGINPRRIKLIAELLKTRAYTFNTQYIVTTHSPLLADLIPQENLFICKKIDGFTQIEPFSAWGPLAKKPAIDDALDAEELTPSERMQRGDFDA